MPTNELSPNRNYPVPVAGNFISYDFPRIRTALLAIDTDVAGLLTSVAGRALTVHSHAIADVTGLEAALDSKHPNTWRPALDDLLDVNVPAPTNGQYLRRVGGEWVPASIGGLDAAVITSGVFDPARIPVLSGQAPIVSSGGLADLSAPQQSAIIAGSIVMTTDGFRWAYSGSGSKTDSASYIQLSDITPEWAVIANKPSAFPPSAHSHPISDVTGLQAALDAKAALGANTFTGDQTISKVNPAHWLRKTASGQAAFLGGTVGANERWRLVLGGDEAETGSDAGSDFRLDRFNDAGAFLGTGMRMRRSDAYTNLYGSLAVGTSGGGHALRVARESAGIGGKFILEKPTAGNTWSGDAIVDIEGERLRFYEGGGSFRGVQVDLTQCLGVNSTNIIHSNNLGASMGNLGAGGVGNYGFMRVDTAGGPGTVRAGSTLRWSDHTAHSSGSTVSGNWILLGHALSNGHIIVCQRIS